VIAAEALERESSYKLFFESNPLPMWIYDSKTLAFIAVNDAAIAHYGYSRSEFLGMSLKEIRPTLDLTNFLASITVDAPGQLVQKGIKRHSKKSR